MERVFFFCCIGSFHSAEMKKYIDTHRYRYVSTISCNKKIEQNMASGLHVRTFPSLQILLKVEQVQKCGFAIGITSTNSLW